MITCLISGFVWQLLASCGWEAIAPQGGMSMVARPTAYEGKCIKGDAYRKEVLSNSNIRDAIMKVTWLSISSSSWTGIPDYCRFMIALSDDDFIASCKALQKFNELVLGSCQASN
jgi:methionine S-methyltransferase